MDNKDKEKNIQRFVELEVTTRLKDFERAFREAEDAAWEHAKETALEKRIDTNSDDFVALFTTLNERYINQIDYLKFFMHTALLLVKNLLNSGTIELVKDGELFTEEEICSKIGEIAEKVVSIMMYTTAGYEVAWIRNYELPDEISVGFLFDPNEIDLND